MPHFLMNLPFTYTFAALHYSHLFALEKDLDKKKTLEFIATRTKEKLHIFLITGVNI